MATNERARKAVHRLFESLWLLAADRDQGAQPDLPIHIGIGDAGHTVHVTAATAEALADAIDALKDRTSMPGAEAPALRVVQDRSES